MADKSSSVKIVFFSPPEHTQIVLNAVFKQGAGVIGNYTNCAFRSLGTGQYIVGDQANAFIGSKLSACEVQEERVEFVCPRSILNNVIVALRSAHPYEEVALDIYELYNY